MHGISLKKVTYAERRHFKEPSVTEPEPISRNRLREIRLGLEECSEVLEVRFWGSPIRPSFGRAKSIAKLYKNS